GPDLLGGEHLLLDVGIRRPTRRRRRRFRRRRRALGRRARALGRRGRRRARRACDRRHVVLLVVASQQQEGGNGDGRDGERADDDPFRVAPTGGRGAGRRATNGGSARRRA